jgi:hypothetical protein
MKKIVLLFVTSLTTIVNGQGITLTSQDFANGGDTVRTSSATDNGYDFTSTGAAYSWDFSALTANNQNLRNFSPMSEAPFFVQFLFGFTAPSNYQASYFIESSDLPIATITSFLPITIENIYQYAKVSADSITNIGYSMKVTSNGSTFDLPIKSDTIETHYSLPLAFGDTHFSRGFSKIDFNPIYNAIWNQHRTRSTTVDGYGSLTTPYGTFDVLRVRHDITETDSIYTDVLILGGTWIPLDLPNVHEYEWWTNGELMPLLKFTTNDVLGNEVVSSIEYRDFYLGLDAGIEELNWNAEMYPVPATDLLTVRSEKNLTKATVVDQFGRQVLQENLSHTPWVVFDVSGLTPGVYTIRLFAGDFATSKKFIKQ